MENMPAVFDKIHYHEASWGSYRIAKKLNDKGSQIGRKQVRTYMREMNIQAFYPRPNVGWAMSNTLHTDFVVRAIEEAIQAIHQLYQKL